MLWPLSCITDATQGNILWAQAYNLIVDTCCDFPRVLISWNVSFSHTASAEGRLVKIVSLVLTSIKRKKWYWDIDAATAERAEGGGGRWHPRPWGLHNQRADGACNTRRAASGVWRSYIPTHADRAASPGRAPHPTCCSAWPALCLPISSYYALSIIIRPLIWNTYRNYCRITFTSNYCLFPVSSASYHLSRLN